MTNGFYDMSVLTTEQLKAFYKEAVLMGYSAHLEHSPSWTRENFSGSSMGEFIDEDCSKSTHNTCIDRYMHSGGAEYEKYGEVGFCRLREIEGKPSFLYVFMTLENLKKLTDKYGLKLKEWPR